MEEYLSRRNQASLIANYQTSGNDARSLLMDPVIDNCQVRLDHFGKSKTKETNHQAKLRKQLHNMHLEKVKACSTKEQNRLKQVNLIELRKQKKFGHVKPRVFHTEDSTIATASTAISLNDSLSFGNISMPLLSENLLTRGSTCNVHSSFGQVPSYILRRKIEEGKKLQRTDEAFIDRDTDKEKENRPVKTFINNKALAKEYEMKINNVKKSLRLLPFGLQSQGSIRKRQGMEADLKKLEHEQRMLLSRKYL